MNRREFNTRMVAVTGLGVGISTGLVPLATLAAWPTSAYDAENIEDAVNALYGTTEAETTDAITFKAPDIAENGAVVPVTVNAAMDGVDSVALLVLENPSPLVATFELANPSATSVGTRIKMGKTSPLIAYARVDGKLYTATSNEVKVTIGGCGG